MSIWESYEGVLVKGTMGFQEQITELPSLRFGLSGA
jgi:hypothetical protein